MGKSIFLTNASDDKNNIFCFYFQNNKSNKGFLYIQKNIFSFLFKNKNDFVFPLKNRQ